MKKLMITMLMIVIASPVFANKHDRDDDDSNNGDHNKKMEMISKELGLSPEQAKKAEESREKYKPMIEEKKKASEAANEKFIAGMKNANATSSELQSLFNQRVEAEKALQETVFQSRMEYREILTPEQRTKLANTREKMMERREERKEKRKENKTR
jgi:protein CpxP